ncbi:hypothetical protein DPMN_007727 [Dreissena polymorpha]|uniref:Endonuclease/exonuclease/phosphatase domain-containing protein n=1 Tax=Dreissena polymorpha TaxID=45954 RepID=A0A9D4MUU5_DREPO|nr:hypothetical protein DPMN_007727 [Dreissena polymorpha]
MFHPLSQLDSTLDSFTSTSVISPLHASSPADRRSTSSVPRHLSSSNTSKTNTSSLYCVSDNRNLRFMNVNCRSLGDGKSSELQAALQYIKPDIVFGTESWLKGIKPGIPPSPRSYPIKRSLPKPLQIIQK